MHRSVKRECESNKVLKASFDLHILTHRLGHSHRYGKYDPHLNGLVSQST